MSDTAMTKMKQSVAEKVTNTYTTALFSKMGSLKTGMGTAADGSAKLADGASKLEDGGQTLSTNLNTLARSSLAFSDGGLLFVRV